MVRVFVCLGVVVFVCLRVGEFVGLFVLSCSSVCVVVALRVCLSVDMWVCVFVCSWVCLVVCLCLFALLTYHTYLPCSLTILTYRWKSHMYVSKSVSGYGMHQELKAGFSTSWGQVGWWYGSSPLPPPPTTPKFGEHTT